MDAASVERGIESEEQQDSARNERKRSREEYEQLDNNKDTSDKVEEFGFERRDGDGYLDVRLGEVISVDDGKKKGSNNRFRVTKIAGKGVFSNVVLCENMSYVKQVSSSDASSSSSNTDSTRLTAIPSKWGSQGAGAAAGMDTRLRNYQTVALKIMRHNDVVRKAGERELYFLKKIAEDSKTKSHSCCLAYLDSFSYLGHLCIVTEGMEMNLRQALNKFGKGVGLNMETVQRYGRQLFSALSQLKALGIVHQDVKLDNILVSTGFASVKLADFGSARGFVEPRHISSLAVPVERIGYQGSRYYRSPEVILGLGPFDPSVDIWAMGCVLFEIFTGKVLFPGRYNNEMLRLMMDMFGRVPAKMIKRHLQAVGAEDQAHFAPNLHFKRIDVDKDTRERSTRQVWIPERSTAPTHAKPNSATPPPGASPLAKLVAPKSGTVQPGVSELIDLIERCLQLEPGRRIAPEQGRKHSFLNPQKP